MPLSACEMHRVGTERGGMTHSMPEALALAAYWLDYARRMRISLAVLIPYGGGEVSCLPASDQCCWSAGFANAQMMAAFRQLTQGEGGAPLLNRTNRTSFT